MNISLSDLRSIADEASNQPVPVRIGLDSYGLTFTATVGRAETRKAVGWHQIAQARFPVQYCTNVIHGLLANVTLARLRKDRP